MSSRSLVVSGRVMSHTADHSDVSEMSSLGEEDLLGDLHPTKVSVGRRVGKGLQERGCRGCREV